MLDVDAVKQSMGSMNIDFSKIKGRDMAVMTRQLATMISSGLSLLQALHVLAEQTEVPKLKTVLHAVRQDVEAGRSLSDALAQHPKVFSTIYVAMVHAGETGGFLEQTLERVADQLEADEALRREVRSAMVYPAVVITLRDDRDDRDDGLHRPDVHGGLQGPGRRAAEADAGHDVDQRRDAPLPLRVRRRDRAARDRRSASGSRPTTAASNGTGCG